MPFPLLNQLQLSWCQFDSSILVQGVKRRFENQKRSGSPADISLSIRNSTVDLEEYDELVKIVGNDRVDWDGVGRELSSSEEGTDDGDSSEEYQ